LNASFDLALDAARAAAGLRGVRVHAFFSFNAVS